MNNIEELKTKLEKARSNARKLDNQIAAIQDEIKKLEEKQGQNKNLKRAECGEKFYKVMYLSGKFIVCVQKETFDENCEACYDNYNYFLTRERAAEVAGKLNFFMRLERLHDELCPNYCPNWQDSNEKKYSALYDHKIDKFVPGWGETIRFTAGTYFPTREIAQKACDELNEKQEQEK